MESNIVEITVLGDVTDDALAALAQAGVDRSVRKTVLEARMRDQAALYGLLEQLRDLGVELSEVRVPTFDPADVEVVVRGPVGPLLISMLEGVRKARETHAVRFCTEAEMVTVIAELAGAARPMEDHTESSTPDDPGAARPHARDER